MSSDSETDRMDRCFDGDEFTTPDGHPWSCGDAKCQEKRDECDGSDDEMYGHCVEPDCHGIVAADKYNSSGVRCHLCGETYCKKHRDSAGGRTCSECGLWLCDVHCDDDDENGECGSVTIKKVETKRRSRDGHHDKKKKSHHHRKYLCTYCADNLAEKKSRDRSLSPVY